MELHAGQTVEVMLPGEQPGQEEKFVGVIMGVDVPCLIAPALIGIEVWNPHNGGIYHVAREDIQPYHYQQPSLSCLQQDLKRGVLETQIDWYMRKLAEAWVDRYRLLAADAVADGWSASYQEALDNMVDTVFQYLDNEDMLGRLYRTMKEIVQQATNPKHSASPAASSDPKTLG